jgi:hypothetical protein
MRLVADPRNRPKARRVFSPSNSVVECIAGPFVECVERIWEAKLGEYLSASDARRHLWHACLASGQVKARICWKRVPGAACLSG